MKKNIFSAQIFPQLGLLPPDIRVVTDKHTHTGLYNIDVVKDGYFSGLISMNIFNDSGGTQKNLVIIH